MRDPGPRPGIKPGPLHCEQGVLTPEPEGFPIEAFICPTVTGSLRGLGGLWTLPAGTTWLHWTRSWDSRLVLTEFFTSQKLRPPLHSEDQQILRSAPQDGNAQGQKLEEFQPPCMAPHSRILAWETPRTVELGGLQSTGLRRAGDNWATSTFTFFQPA